MGSEREMTETALNLLQDSSLDGRGYDSRSYAAQALRRRTPRQSPRHTERPASL
jgi:hypothetical protein